MVSSEFPSLSELLEAVITSIQHLAQCQEEAVVFVVPVASQAALTHSKQTGNTTAEHCIVLLLELV